MNYLFGFLKTTFLAFLYRFRGGGFWQTGHTALVRFLWSFGFALTVYLTVFNPILSFLTMMLMFCAISWVPHSFCMQMGRNPNTCSTLPTWKWWPIKWILSYTQEEWTVLSHTKKVLYDYLGMTLVGLIRGIIAFTASYLVYGIIICLFSYFNTGIFTYDVILSGMLTSLNGVLAITLLQPFVYWIGWFIPITIGKSLTANTTEWPEFFNGAAWFIAIWALTL
jgi:hypothetical protein